jgi:ribosome maturation factor RimP
MACKRKLAHACSVCKTTCISAQPGIYGSHPYIVRLWKGWRHLGPAPGSFNIASERLKLPDLDKLTALIAPEAEALGFALVRVAWFETGGQGSDEPTLQVMAERPDTRQLHINDCAVLSHRISDLFDEIDPIVEAYRLEVSSPGIDRPLTRLADFADWAGHEVKVELAEPMDGRRNIRGDIVGVDGETISVDDRKSGRLTFAFANLGSAKLLLTDRLIASTAPINADGADEVEAEPINDDQQEEDNG